jgi:sucrose-6-phosphate hydrolase SacC (GH32 family)
MSNWDYANVVPTTAWRSAMTLPRRLALRRTDTGLRLASRPVREVQSLRGEGQRLPPMDIDGRVALEELGPATPDRMELVLEFAPADGDGRFGVELANARGETYRVGFDAAKGQYFSDRRQAGANDFADNFASGVHVAPRLTSTGNVELHLFFDVASAELFADGGLTVMTEIFFPSEPFSEVWLFQEGEGSASLRGGRLYPIATIW